MDHRITINTFEAFTHVENFKGGFLHSITRGSKTVYWISQFAHAGEIMYTGMYDKESGEPEKPWPDTQTALRFLGFMHAIK